MHRSMSALSALSHSSSGLSESMSDKSIAEQAGRFGTPQIVGVIGKPRTIPTQSVYRISLNTEMPISSPSPSIKNQKKRQKTVSEHLATEEDIVAYLNAV